MAMTESEILLTELVDVLRGASFEYDGAYLDLDLNRCELDHLFNSLMDWEARTREHEAFTGINVDHLYQNCPALQRSLNGPTPKRHPSWRIGQRTLGTIDPLDTDICGWCQRKWKATQ